MEETREQTLDRLRRYTMHGVPRVSVPVELMRRTVQILECEKNKQAVERKQCKRCDAIKELFN